MPSSHPSSSSSSRSDEEEGRWSLYEGPNRFRRRANDDVWPEPFLEALALRTALDTSRLAGRLAVAPALATIFQVCSTWRAVSRSDPMWAHLTGGVWDRRALQRDTWREEYIYWHRTAGNFREGVARHHLLEFDSSNVDPDALSCLRLALSDRYLACGFADGSVRLFDLLTCQHCRTFRHEQNLQLGRFSRAVSGIILGPTTVVFATLDGDVHVAVLDGLSGPRVVHAGDIVESGPLVDFAGCARWWVGLFAGVPGKAFHIWDANMQIRTFVGGSLTDPEAVIGWHTLTDPTVIVGRVRMVPQLEMAVACTESRLVAFDLRQGRALAEEDCRRGIMVRSLDVTGDVYVIVDARGMATERRVGNLEDISRFSSRASRGDAVVGCRNGGYALMWSGGVVRVFGLEQGGEFLYGLGDGVVEVNAMVANERHVAAAGEGNFIHLWDFGQFEVTDIG